MNEFMKYSFDEFVKRDKYGNPSGGEIVKDQLDIIQKELDSINHPKHYTFGEIEVLDAIEDWELGFHLGNVIKYVARAKHKGKEIEDLQKAKFYLDRYLELKKEKEGEKYCEEID